MSNNCNNNNNNKNNDRIYNKINFILIIICLIVFVINNINQVKAQDSHIVNNEECKKGDTIMRDCNLCKCIRGSFACTRMLCPTIHTRLKRGNQNECNFEYKKIFGNCFQCTCYNYKLNCKIMKNCKYIKDVECIDGEFKRSQCQTCKCLNNKWLCNNNNNCSYYSKSKNLIECTNGDNEIVGCTNCTCINQKWNCHQLIDCNECGIHGTYKKVGCNECICKYGKWYCFIDKNCQRSDILDCLDGTIMKKNCMDCICLNNKWKCKPDFFNSGCNNYKSKADCHPDDPSSTTNCRSLKNLVKRGVPVAADLKNTPCAPNDYFTIDCNTCYCNIDKTGYLCTENLCSFTENPLNSTTTSTLISLITNNNNNNNNITTPSTNINNSLLSTIMSDTSSDPGGTTPSSTTNINTSTITPTN